jgi:hypothetical protein
MLGISNLMACWNENGRCVCDKGGGDLAIGLVADGRDNSGLDGKVVEGAKPALAAISTVVPTLGLNPDCCC